MITFWNLLAAAMFVLAAITRPTLDGALFAAAACALVAHLEIVRADLRWADRRLAELTGQPLGRRRDRPHHPTGWHVDRDAEQAQGSGRRPPLADNLTDHQGGTPR